MLSGTLQLAPVYHVHATVYFLWAVLALVQTGLTATGRTAVHRDLGMAGIALATAMVFTGVLAAIRSIYLGVDAGFETRALAFSIVPLGSMLFFAPVFALAIARVRQPALHKRAMLLGYVALLEAPVARWFVAFGPPAPPGPPAVSMTLFPALLADLLIVAAIVFDWRRRGRPHPLLLIGGGVLVASQILRGPFSTTATWQNIAAWFAGLAA